MADACRATRPISKPGTNGKRSSTPASTPRSRSYMATSSTACRRVVVDGVEPVDRPSDSIQFELFEYVYHQILRKDPEWVARDLLRQDYRRLAEAAARRAYDPGDVGCLLLVTSREVMLEELISRPLDEGDMLSGANTVILMGKIRKGDRLDRALAIAKHRGSPCDERIVPFSIDDHGLSAL